MAHLLQGEKYAFLKMKAPASYVAGLGRGASGFTTRSDIGPAREGPSDETVAAAQAARGEEQGGAGEEEDPEGRYQDPENETGLFAGGVYEQDDEEADRIYEMVDEKMDERRRARREKREKEELERERKERPTIQSQFADLKRGLTDVSEQEWENIPEVKNQSYKKRKVDNPNKTYAVPDSVLLGSMAQSALASSLTEDDDDGTRTSMNAMTDFQEIGAANQQMLSLKLQQLDGTATSGGGSSAASGTSTSVDPTGYLTGLSSLSIKSATEIGDIKRARSLLASLTKTNPKHAPGWVASAWLENVAGKQVAARKLIAQGCQECPKNEDVWIAAAELNTNENAKVVLAQAIQELPESVRIWMKAVELEREQKAKKRVLRKALEYVPQSVRLWKEAVQLEEDPADARTLLARAVEVIPLSSELWLALARLETPEKAKGVLNKARKTIPTSHEIWIAAGRLQEQEGQGDAVDKVIAAGVVGLRKNGAELSREQWRSEAERCEAQGSPLTAQAIIKATVHLEVEDEDREKTWLDDAESLERKGAVECARAVYAVLLRSFPGKVSGWRRAADLERSKCTRETLVALLNRATEAVPQAEVLWLMAAKEAWLSGDVDGARATLSKAFESNPESESIWLAAVKLEAENGELAAAATLMKSAREIAGTERIWVKAAVFARKHSTREEALQMARDGLVKFPASDKLHLVLAQLLQAGGETAKARESLGIAVKRCPSSAPLWIMASRLEEQQNMRIKARALLERARLLNPKDVEIWLESVKVEERDGGGGAAKSMLARALTACPTSGALHEHSIWGEARPTRKTRSVDALKKTNNAVEVIVTVARLFWAERKVDKARDWFTRATTSAGEDPPDFGDMWAWWYAFELEHGSVEQQEDVLKCAEAAEPHHGRVWQVVAKDPANEGKSARDVVKLVATALGKNV